MNARRIIYFLPFLQLFVIVGCSGSPSVETGQERMPVMFSTEFSALTRASTIDNVWNGDDAIAISNGTDTHRYTIVATSSAGGIVNLSSVYEEQFFWPTNDPLWTFTAWYPYHDGEQWTSVSLASDQRGTSDDTPADEGTLAAEDYHNYDILYAQTVSEYHKRVHLLFYHQLAHVVVKATVVPSSGTAHERITGISLGSDNIALNGNIAMGTTGASVATPTVVWTVPAATNTIKMRHTATAGALYTYECMLPPQTVGDANTPLLTITTTDGSLTRTYLYKSEKDFQPGYEYTFTITITELGIIRVNNLTIESWGTGAGGTGTVK